MATVAIDHVEAVSTAGICLAVKVLEGTICVDASLKELVSPDGERRAVDLKVAVIHRYPDVMVDELEENFGGLITLYGLYPNGIGPDWTLTT